MATDESNAASLANQLALLHDDNPRLYTLLQRHLDELRDVLEQTDRNYVSAKQLQSNWNDPPFQPQIMGQLLSTAADLGILRVHTHRSSRNRYDLTAYDPAQMQRLAQLLAIDVKSDEHDTTNTMKDR